MDEIVIKKIENGYLVTHAGKSYIATNYGKILTQLINKLLKPATKKEKDTPPPIPAAAKKVALNEG